MKKIIFGLLCLTIVVGACKKSNLSDAPLSVIIEGTVYDKKTNAVVAGDTVILVTRGTTIKATTDDNGFYSFSSLLAGDYVLTIMAEGYLNAVINVSSSDITVNGKSDVVIVSNSTYLTPLTESGSFTIYQSYGSATIAAANAPYTITFSNAGNDEITGTTDANGLVSLTNMPYEAYFYMNLDYTVDGVRYKRIIRFHSSWDPIASAYTVTGYIDNGSFGLVSSNTLDDRNMEREDFPINGNIELKFTQPVDTASAAISITNYLYSFDEAWSQGNMMLTIDADSAFDYDSFYRVNINLMNADKDQSINTNYGFTTVAQ